MHSITSNLRIGRSILSLAIPAILANGCAALQSSGLLDSIQKPSIESITPHITGIDWKGVNLAFDVGVKNPYGIPIKSPKFDYSMAIADQQVLTDATSNGIDLPASGTGSVTLPVHLSYADAWKAAAKLKDAKEVPYTLKGNLLMSPMGQEIKLPVEKSGTVPVLRPPTISDISMAQPEVGGSSAQVAMDMTVANPNVFELGLQNLGYQMKIGDVEVGSIKASSPSALAPGQSQRVHLSGAVSGLSAIGKILTGGKIGAPSVNAIGSVQTPYGAVKTP